MVVLEKKLGCQFWIFDGFLDPNILFTWWEVRKQVFGPTWRLCPLVFDGKKEVIFHFNLYVIVIGKKVCQSAEGNMVPPFWRIHPERLSRQKLAGWCCWWTSCPRPLSIPDDDGQHGVNVVDEHMFGLLSTFIFVFAYLCIYLFVYFTFDTRKCHNWYPWIPCF